MEPKPKERIVFDEDSYYGDEGAEWAVNDLMERKGLTEDEVRESFTDDEVFQHAMKLRDFDYEEGDAGAYRLLRWEEVRHVRFHQPLRRQPHFCCWQRRTLG